MKKVLLAINCLFGGGAERVVSVWANQLSKKGYDVAILVDYRNDGEYSIPNDVKVFSVADDVEALLKMGKLRRMKKMRSLVKSLAPDVIINFLERMQIWMMFATFGLNVRRIETVRNNPWVTCGDSKVLRFLWNKCFKRSDKIILQTAEQGEYFRKNTQEKCVIVPNPIAAKYKEETDREVPNHIKKFIAAGRLNPQKNYPLMIRAFSSVAKNNDITLDIFGAGDKKYRNELQSLIDELKMSDKIKLRGRTSNLINEYKNAHAYLMTSDFEGMPNALAEAMATELVCISSNCRTGPKDLIDNNENGFLFETGNQKELEELIEKVAFMDKETATNVGKKAREKVLSFLSEENSLNKLMEIIDKA